MLTPQEATEQFILDNLTLEKAVYLIFTHIPKLPNRAPPDFQKDYESFVSQGNIGKIYLANVLAQQFSEAKVGPGVQIEAKLKAFEMERKKREREEEESKNEKVSFKLNIETKFISEFIFCFRLPQRRRKLKCKE